MPNLFPLKPSIVVSFHFVVQLVFGLATRALANGLFRSSVFYTPAGTGGTTVVILAWSPTITGLDFYPFSGIPQGRKDWTFHEQSRWDVC